MKKIDIANKILEEFDKKTSVNWNFKDTYINAILKGLEGVELVEITHAACCQSCGKDFEENEIVYYVPLDTNIVCNKCVQDHNQKETMIFKK